MRAMLAHILLTHIPGPSAPDLRRRIFRIYAVLIAANVAAWVWAFLALRHFPLQMYFAFIAYSFGLRHAVDADHIAAIDNVTRKLMHDGKRPVAAGLFFSLGHSTIVVLASAAVAATAMAFRDRFEQMHRIGSSIGTIVSATFLLAIALMNVVVLVQVYQAFQRTRSHGAIAHEDQLNLLLCGGGWLARTLRPLFAAITQSWHMYPLGLLFGLGFDTATEVGLLGISAAAPQNGVPLWSILVFPALFTAGMALIDTTDGILMLGAYGWAFVKPVRKLYYNMTITAVSVLVAVLVGGIEMLGLVADHFNLSGPFWQGIAELNSHFGLVGFGVIGIFIASWAVAAGVYRWRGFDKPEAEVARSAA